MTIYIYIYISLICLDCKTENLNFPRALEHTTLDEMFPSNLSVQSSENPAEEEAEGVGRQRVKRRPEAQGPLRQLSKSHTNSQRACTGPGPDVMCMYYSFQ